VPSLNPSLPPSGNFNLSTWNLTLPTGTAGHPDVISTTKLDSGYTSQYFYTGPDGAMTFWCPDTGVTTSGSSYPRTELRETKSDGTLYNWNVLDGTATLNATLAVNVVPGTGKIVIGQIHDNGAGGVKDEPLLKVIYEYSSTTGTGKIVAQIRSTPTSSNTDYTLATGIKLNTLFSYQIQLRSDLTLSVQINGVTEYSSGPIDTSWESQGLYFKAGDYDQDNVGPSTDGGQVSFYSLTVTHASTSSGSTLSASTFLVTGYASPTTAGASHSFTITAKDTLGNTATGYVGTITFTSSDPKAILPANYTFTSADAGVHIFSATLKTAGSQSITATDTATASITGKESGITVNPAAASKLVVSGYPSPTIAGISHSFTITAQDAFGNTASGYTGTVAFTSSDGQAALPANYGFTSADGGVHSFAAILKTAGSQSITATDTVTNSIKGSQTGISVNPAALSGLRVTAPRSVTAGHAFTITVSAVDSFSNVISSYLGTVRFTSTDNQAVLPGDYTFVAADAGGHVFTNVITLKTVGSQMVTATDTVNTTLTDLATITVNSGILTPALFGRESSTGQVWGAVSNGSTGFSNSLWSTLSTAVTWVDVLMGDFNGDGKTDIVGRYLQAGQWWMGQSTGSSFTSSLWAT